MTLEWEEVISNKHKTYNFEFTNDIYTSLERHLSSSFIHNNHNVLIVSRKIQYETIFSTLSLPLDSFRIHSTDVSSRHS